MAAGIDTRHTRGCRSRDDGRCNCDPTFQAHVFDGRSGKRIRKTFDTSTGARMWRQDALVALRMGTLRASDGRTLKAAADEWLAAARSGEVRNRSGDRYKPSAIRGYEQNLRLRVLPDLADRKFTAIRRVDLQELVDRLHASDLSPSSVQCALLPLRAMYRRALARGEVAINPTTGLELPAIRGGRDRIAAPDEATRLLDALPATDRPLWATAMYAGLRRGELRAIRWEDIDLAAGKIHVRRGWDDVEGEITPKSAKGVRTVPIAAVLRDYLDEHRLRALDTKFVFGDGQPFRPDAVAKRAKDAWEGAKLTRITLHECRHTYASLMIAAGVNAKALSTYMGHANIAITLDKYGHLMPGNEQEAATLLDAYLERCADAARAATGEEAVAQSVAQGAPA
jgi:integrase